MALTCRVFRGLAKEVEEDVNKFLTTHDVHVVNIVQSETADHITITLLIEEPGHLPDVGL
jgi:hypothetical protein